MIVLCFNLFLQLHESKLFLNGLKPNFVIYKSDSRATVKCLKNRNLEKVFYKMT